MTLLDRVGGYFQEPSPPFFKLFYIPALSAGQLVDYTAEASNGVAGVLRPYRLYLPFMNAQITNTSASPLLIYFDYSPDRVLFSAAGGAPGSHNQPFSSFQIKNIGLNPTTANQVYIWVERL